MNTTFNIKPKGYVTIKLNGITIHANKRNAIAPLAKEIAAKRLIQHPTSTIDKIRIYNGTTQIAEGQISATTIVNPQEVQFDCEFLAASFSGFFDRVALVASGIGPFAELEGLQITKGLTEPLLITWKIKII